MYHWEKKITQLQCYCLKLMRTAHCTGQVQLIIHTYTKQLSTSNNAICRNYFTSVVYTCKILQNSCQPKLIPPTEDYTSVVFARYLPHKTSIYLFTVTSLTVLIYWSCCPPTCRANCFTASFRTSATVVDDVRETLTCSTFDWI